MHEKTANYGALSSLPLLRPLPNSYPAQHRSNPLLFYPNRPDKRLLLPTTRRLQPNCPDDRVEMPNGSPPAVRMEGDNSFSHHKTPRADLLSLERSWGGFRESLAPSPRGEASVLPSGRSRARRSYEAEPQEVIYAVMLSQSMNPSNGRPRAHFHH